MGTRDLSPGNIAETARVTDANQPRSISNLGIAGSMTPAPPSTASLIPSQLGDVSPLIHTHAIAEHKAAALHDEKFEGKVGPYKFDLHPTSEHSCVNIDFCCCYADILICAYAAVIPCGYRVCRAVYLSVQPVLPHHIPRASHPVFVPTELKPSRKAPNDTRVSSN